MKTRPFVLLFLATLLVLPSVTPRGIDTNQKSIVVFYESWSDTATDAGSSGLSSIPSYMNIVILSFVKPETDYGAGSMDLSNTGLNFQMDGNALKEAIANLKSTNPNTKVLISVGGASYTSWDSLNPQAICNLAIDIGADGIDIDFEPQGPACTASDGSVSCSSDGALSNAIQQFRSYLTDTVLSLTGLNTGAYGVGDFANDGPVGEHQGACVNALKDYGDQLDFINVMSYDGGPASDGFDPTRAVQAYQALFSGPVMYGMQVPPEYGDHVLTLDEVGTNCGFVNDNGAGGIMIWDYQKDGSPSASDIASTACDKFGTCSGFGSSGLEASPADTNNTQTTYPLPPPAPPSLDLLASYASKTQTSVPQGYPSPPAAPPS